ncbi:MAG: efflux RND transporter periplasmic adaptor subunit [Beijerinckiaceae bacterium]|nr:efflux RND transporter periplasmic adaptor subunit [Beijerinckiaceae bacterium]
MKRFPGFRNARLGLAAIFVASALYGVQPAQLYAGSASEPRQSAAEAVSVTKAKTGCFEDITEVAGVLVPKEVIPVRPDREGLLVSEVLVEAGASVKSGATLAKLASPESQRGPGSQVPVQAPETGIVVAANAVVGARASAMAEPLFQIIPGGLLELRAQAPAKRLAKLSPGLPAAIRIPGAGEFLGETRFISSTVDAATQLGEVFISLRFDPRLRAGMFARAGVNAGKSCGNAAVPLTALLFGEEGTVVQIVREGRVESRIVKTGLQSGGKMEIHQGVADGDMVVARAGAFLRDGDQVRPIPIDDAASQE